MQAERWQQVKELFEAALALPPSERSRYLTTNCEDADLRLEVESLLAAGEETSEFLEVPIANLQSFHRESPEDTAAIGMRVGPWELVEEIGRGGMGTVYMAVRADQEYRQRVAIKLIRRGMEHGAAVKRFRNERQILAKLEHPCIARLIDGGTTRDGMPYFVMEYVEGEPLHRYCDTHSLPPSERIAIFLKVCSAVHYAHRRMIIHRDLKPGNILVKKDGTPKLLDFGIAKLLDNDDSERLETTLVGARIVTPAYASPEQMRGEAATVRSDIYALAVVLFELLTGRRPAQDPTAFEQLEPGLRRVVTVAMRPEPCERYDSVEALTSALQRALDGQEQPTDGSTPSTGRAAAGSVAVLPFRVLSTGEAADAYLGLGITDAVITRLSNVGRISVRPTSAVMRFADAPDAAAAGRDLNVEFVVEGRVQRTGDRVRTTVQLVRTRTGVPAWAGTFDEEVDDLLKVEDSISGQVAQALIPQLSGEEKEQLARRGTANPKAHQAYLRGRWYWSRHTEEGLAKALVSFMQAIAEDPNYGQAHAGVADYYIQLGAWGGLPPHESFAAAKQSAEAAVEIDPSLAEAHASLGFAIWACDRDAASASHEFQMSIALNPDYAPAHHWLGLLNSARGKAEVAIASLERGRKLDPQNPTLIGALGLACHNARMFDRSLALLESAIQTIGDVPVLYEMTAWNRLQTGDIEGARQAARRAAELSGRTLFPLCALAHAEAAAGNRSAVSAILAEVDARGTTRYVSGYGLALIHLAAGDRDRALDELERAWKLKDWWTVWLAVGPHWDVLRNEPRFRALLTDGAPFREAPKALPLPIAPVHSRRRFLIGAGAGAAAVALGTAGYLRWRTTPIPFEKAKLEKITTNGTAQRAAISPDGTLVAFQSRNHGESSVYVRPVGGSAATRIAGPFHTNLENIEFTRRGTHLALAMPPESDPNAMALYLLPVAGGIPEKVIPHVQGPLGISPDGSSVAFLRPNPREGADELVIAEVNGTGERRVATRHYPDRFTFNAVPAWSADSRSVACGIEGTDAQGFRMSILVVDVASGATRTPHSPRWQYIGRLAWSGDSRALFVIGQEQDASFQQIWFLPLRRGEWARLTNDLNDYMTVSLSLDTSRLVSVQRQTLSNVYVLPPGADANRPAAQVTPGNGRYFDLAWAPSGQIVYASDASGSADIWIMNADGSGQRQVTPGTGRSYSPAVSPDGKWIVYHSNRSGNWNIWRMDADGRNSVQLTRGTRDSNWPQFTLDGSAVIYHHTGPDGMFNIWRVAINGGEPVQLTENLTTHPAVSPVDGRIACWYSEEVTQPDWQIAILPAEGGAPQRLLSFPTGFPVDPDMPLRWTPDGKAITFIDTRSAAHNLRVLPIDGGPPRDITSFPSGEIFSFAWTREGRLAVSRGMSTSDVVLLRQR